MDTLVKQRLVGALILIALAVVFWPIIFVQDERQSEGLVVSVPAAPPVDRTPLPEPDSAGLRTLGDARAQGEPVPDVAVPEELSGGGAGTSDGVAEGAGALSSRPPDTETIDPAPLPALPSNDDVLPERSLESVRDDMTTPELDEDGLPIAFSLQVATMADRARAEQLRDELVSAGYKGYVKRLRRDDTNLYRVLVGPKFQRDDLVAVKTAVDEAWRVDSLIIRYLP